MKKVARYLKTKMRVTQRFDWQEAQTKIRTQSDSDWAGDCATRKSTSGGTIRIGAHLLKSWSKDQRCIATSSGEAELYAASRAAAESLGIQAVMIDLGIEMRISLELDAKATIGTVSRQGLGSLKHVEVHDLWLQEAVKRRKIEIMKVPRLTNTADMLCSPSKAEDIYRHMRVLGFDY